MEGGTTFHFVTDGFTRRRRYLDIKIGSGASTVRQDLRAGLIDELHLTLSTVVLGRGEVMFEGLVFPELGYRLIETAPTELATHVVIGRSEKADASAQPPHCRCASPVS
jgi:dihydrofolate reductase